MLLQGSELEMIILRIRCTHGQKLFSLCMKTYNLYIEKLIFQSTKSGLNVGFGTLNIGFPTYILTPNRIENRMLHVTIFK